MSNEIRIDQNTLHETVEYNSPQLPYKTDLCSLHGYPGSTFPWHWHADVELFYMREGAIEYHVPGGVHLFREGEAGFLNANVLHMTRALPDTASLQEEHIFPPSFVSGGTGSAIEAKYVRPILRSGGLDIIKLDPAGAAIQKMRAAHDLAREMPFGYELSVRALMSEVWMIVFAQCRDRLDAKGRGPDDARLKDMLTYIADHYAEQISMADIARAGYVGERECFRVFQRNLDMTPLQCLTEQRLNHACELLRFTALPVTEIALRCGFCGGSYFGKVFREHLHTTPRAYRLGTNQDDLAAGASAS